MFSWIAKDIEFQNLRDQNHWHCSADFVCSSMERVSEDWTLNLGTGDNIAENTYLVLLTSLCFAKVTRPSMELFSPAIILIVFKEISFYLVQRKCRLEFSIIRYIRDFFLVVPDFIVFM
uniref:Uncharacterized protein n=1 Tax=Tetranychus urticae TaxID=32264 RepID=T1L4G3_TETUR